MTIKRRFFISYISAILITFLSLLLVLVVATYVTLGQVPSIPEAYKMLTKQRSLTSAEETSYLAFNRLIQENPQNLNVPLQPSVKKLIQETEAKGLGVVIRKGHAFPYYSSLFVRKSLVAHAPAYETNNLMPTGTLDNAGRLFHYVKSDFLYPDGQKGSFIVLKRESNLFEFFTRWAIWLILLILSVSVAAAWFINYRLKKTTIEPLERLEQASKKIGQQRTENPFQATTAGAISSEVQQLQLSFEQMWHELAASEKQREKYETNRKELVSNISHDLKTPITSIIGYVEGLLDGVATTEEKKEQYLRIIHEKSLNLNELIESLFLYSKLDVDGVLFHFQTVDFVPYLQHILEDYHWEKPVKIDMQLPGKPLPVALDPVQMNRVLTNLVQNSLKFFDPQKEQLLLTFSLTATAQTVTLKLTDNGIGIAPEELPHLFERFYRVDKSRTATVKGSGLGLSIVKQILDAHEGSIQVESQLGQGTCVTLKLPLAKKGHTQ